MSYVTDTIFEDTRLNALIDKIYNEMYAQFPPSESDDVRYIEKTFLLSGRAADILQGATAQPIKNIVFQTKNETFYNFCKIELPKIFQCKAVFFKERILIYPLDYFFEIWLTAPEVVLTLVIQGTNFILDESLIPDETK